jgi:hypothetical protein
MFRSAKRREGEGNHVKNPPSPLPRIQSTRFGILLMTSISARTGHAYQYLGRRKVLRETGFIGNEYTVLAFQRIKKPENPLTLRLELF